MSKRPSIDWLDNPEAAEIPKEIWFKSTGIVLVGCVFLAVFVGILISLMNGTGDNERSLREIHNAMPGVVEPNPPADEQEFHRRVESGYYPYGPGPNSGYPGIRQHLKKPQQKAQ